MGQEEHRAAAPPSISVYIVTLSDTRDESNDTSGAAIRNALQAAGHRLAGWRILREDAASLRHQIDEILRAQGFDALIVNGGTGIAPRDIAFDVLSSVYERHVPGFGELFRSLSYAEIGSAAMLSRASAGVAHGKLVFSIPGSTGAVHLALDRLILPELGHMVAELWWHSRRAYPPSGGP
jgi:molybdenum cofactor biosynthesis protein B